MKFDEIKVNQILRFVIPQPRRVIAERVIVKGYDSKTKQFFLDNPDDNSDDLYSSFPNPATGNYDSLEIIETE